MCLAASLILKVYLWLVDGKCVGLLDAKCLLHGASLASRQDVEVEALVLLSYCRSHGARSTVTKDLKCPILFRPQTSGQPLPLS